MGVVVNCDEKDLYIEKILHLDEDIQEDLKKLIERSLNRMSIDVEESSVITDSTQHQELLATIERLEREKKIINHKVQELESEMAKNRKEMVEKEQEVKMLNLKLKS